MPWSFASSGNPGGFSGTTSGNPGGGMNATYIPPLTILTTGLLMYLDASSTISYPGSGNTWKDLSGNNNNMTLNANATYVATNGGGFKRGASGDIASGVTLPLTGDYSVSMWVKTLTASGEPNLIRMTGAGGGHRIFHAGNGNIYFSGQFTGFSQQNMAQTSTFNENNKLIYLTTTYQNSIEYYRLYVGAGSLQWTGDGSPPEWGLTAPGTVPIVLGEAYQNLEIYSLKIYNTVLSSAQILANYNATRTRFGV